MGEKLLDPTGTTERAVDTTLAPRLRSLRGLTAGLLENGKPNAALARCRPEYFPVVLAAWESLVAEVPA